MTEWPLTSLAVSDFRRIEGTRTIPLDAPIVLIHGPNGTGKTSILSALEMALTGRVESMARQDNRYTAHLPFTGQEFATVQVDVASALRPSLMERMTVGGSRVAGEPALNRDLARFFSERCYLDQASLGRLLELYQLRDGKQESLLARFVNELLGLEHLDALRSGLHDATDLRLLKNLATNLAEADNTAKRASVELKQASSTRENAGREFEQATAAVAQLLTAAGIDVAEADVDQLLELAQDGAGVPDPVLPRALDVDRELAALRGRIEAVAERPTSQRLFDARTVLDETVAANATWRERRQPSILRWADAASSAGIDLSNGWSEGLAGELTKVSSLLSRQDQVRREQTAAEQLLASHERDLAGTTEQLTAAQVEASTLVEGLATLSGVITDNTCPVCDRDFAELRIGHLSDHLDTKLARLAEQGAALTTLRRRRDELAQEVGQLVQARNLVAAQVLDAEGLGALESRRLLLESFGRQFDELDPIIREGESVNAAERDARRVVEQLETADREYAHIDAELARFAADLDTAVGLEESALQACRRLSELSAAAIEALQVREVARRNLAEGARRLNAAKLEHKRLTTLVAEILERKSKWESRVTEAKRRQRVAREVHDAASAARTTIVQRVFTESLNNVWADLFMRLAPSEEFIPAFGIPSATKTTLEVSLETRLRNGELGGPPQMMLSAGNLNTAALSLFIALHLAVEPRMRCLVFDDPVQAMDEVHVAQFAALIRTLAKQLKRQVVIAVHERELFDYLTLELSPAYAGDTLITVELGDRANDVDRGIRRREYSEDRAITG
ncbi:AAA family ATPase [Nocardioides salarius]|nr:AAA family ATPase [Nocardioides salarius]